MLFKNAWYVVARSSSVTARPQRVRALLQDLVLYRRASDQQVVALSDLCVHRRAVWGEYEWKAHYTRVVENTVDVAHTPFVHARSFGNTKTAVMPPYEVTVSPHALRPAPR